MTAVSAALILADTNILVHYVRKSALYQRIEATYSLTTIVPAPLLSIVTRGEILSLTACLGWGSARRKELETFVTRCTTVNLDFPGLVSAYADMDAYSLNIGRKLGDNDIWIAATAHVTNRHVMIQERSMPQPKKYANRADQQAAYRQRRACSERELRAQKGLPPLPTIPTLPGHARWRAMLAQAQALLGAAAEEMQTYHDERSEAWQESANAEELLAKLERLQETMAQLEDCE